MVGVYDTCLSPTVADDDSEHEPKMWDNLKGQFLNHLDEVNSDLKAHGLPSLVRDA